MDVNQPTQSVNYTFISKYGCEKEYHGLKECMRNAEPGKIKSICENHYTFIGKCILSKNKENLKKWKIWCRQSKKWRF